MLLIPAYSEVKPIKFSGAYFQVKDCSLKNRDFAIFTSSTLFQRLSFNLRDTIIDVLAI